MLKDRTAQIEPTALATEVEGLVEPVEPDGVFRDTRECKAGLLLLALLVASPPVPRPKTGNR